MKRWFLIYSLPLAFLYWQDVLPQQWKVTWTRITRWCGVYLGKRLLNYGNNIYT